jgi:predicted small secreted protein
LLRYLAETPEEDMIKKTIIAFALGAMTLSAAACNTVRGAGEDLESAADTVEDEM